MMMKMKMIPQKIVNHKQNQDNLQAQLQKEERIVVNQIICSLMITATAMIMTMILMTLKLKSKKN